MSKSKLNFKILINRLILFIVFGVLAHIIFVLSTTEKRLLLYVNKLSLWHIFLMASLMVLPWIGYAIRVRMWSKFLGENINFKDALRIVMTADLASALSPTAVGGAPVKAALLLNRGFNPGNVGFMLTWGIIEDIFFYTTGILLALFFSQNLVNDIANKVAGFFIHYGYYIAAFTILITIYITSLRFELIPKVFRPLHYLPIKLKQRLYNAKLRFYASIKEMNINFNKAWQHGKLRMLIGITILFMQWAAKFSVLIVILNAFEIDFNSVQIYIRQWVIYVTMLFIPTPGASGGAEASFLLIFGKSIPADISFLIVSIWRFFTYYYVLIASVLLYISITFFSKKQEDIEIETEK